MSLDQLTVGLDRFSIGFMIFEALFVPWLMLDKTHLTPFAARKMCHAGSGLIMMLLNCQAALCRYFIYAVAIVSLTMNWELFPKLLPNFWFATPRDKGITLYLVLVAVWVFLGHPLRILAPVFLADPAGAVVGRWMTSIFPKDNPKWLGNKTVAGSAAVFLATFVTLYRPLEPAPRVMVSLLAMLGEAVGGAFDNLVIAIVVIAFSGTV